MMNLVLMTPNQLSTFQLKLKRHWTCDLHNVARGPFFSGPVAQDIHSVSYLETVISRGCIMTGFLLKLFLPHALGHVGPD